MQATTQGLAELASPATVASAAGNTPKQGSITQSSDADTNGVTADTVQVTTNSSGTVMLTYNNNTLVDTGDNNAEESESDAVEKSILSGNAPAEGSYLYERISDEDDDGFSAVLFYRKLTEAEAQGLDSSTTGGGNLWVAVYTRQTGSNNTDYLSAGIWVYSPDADSEDQEFGVFADGSDPFAQDNLHDLAGTATYRGEAFGVYADGNIKNSYFSAESELTADFGNDTALGTVSGRVYNIEIDDEIIDPELTLSTAGITDTEGGFFTGDTSIEIDGVAHAGKWGGQFYGNDDTAPTAHPASVMGTFGATSEQSSISILGIFEAHK